MHAQVSKARNYTPTNEDMGYTLKYECTALDVNRPYVDMGRPGTVFSARVRAMPNPPTRSYVPLKPPHGVQTTPAGKFSVLTYNMLADLYAKVWSTKCMSVSCQPALHAVVCPACCPLHALVMSSVMSSSSL